MHRLRAPENLETLCRLRAGSLRSREKRFRRRVWSLLAALKITDCSEKNDWWLNLTDFTLNRHMKDEENQRLEIPSVLQTQRRERINDHLRISTTNLFLSKFSIRWTWNVCDHVWGHCRNEDCGTLTSKDTGPQRLTRGQRSRPNIPTVSLTCISPRGTCLT